MSAEISTSLAVLTRDILATDPARSTRSYYVDISPPGSPRIVGDGAGGRDLSQIAERLFEMLSLLAPDRMENPALRFAAEIPLADVSSHDRLGAHDRLRTALTAIGQAHRIPEFLTD